jgi:hypothetical protein
MSTTFQNKLKPTKYRAVDTSGNNNHGQIYSGRALEFDGVGDYLDMGSNIINGTTWTIAFWIGNYTEGSNFDFIIGSGTADNIALQSAVSGDGNHIAYRCQTTNGTSTGRYWSLGSNIPLQNGTCRLIITSDGTTIKSYLNGQEHGSITVGVTQSTVSDGVLPNTNAQIRYINGGYSASNYFVSCFMSDCQIWDTAWSASDALYDYLNPESLVLNNNGTSLTESNLKIWYPMQDGHRGQESYILDGANTGLGDAFDFDNDGTWTHSVNDGSGATAIGNVITFTNNSDNSTDNRFDFSRKLLDGVTYKINCTVSNSNLTGSGNSIYLPYDGYKSITYSQRVFADGTYEYYYTSNGYNNFLVLTTASGNNGVTGTVTINFIKPVNDKHHATTVFEGDEMIATQANRQFTSSGQWAGYNSPTSAAIVGTKFQIVTSVSGTQGATLPVANLTAPVIGRTYRIKAKLDNVDGANLDATYKFGFGGTSETITASDGTPNNGTITTSEEEYYADVVAANTDGDLIILIPNAANDEATTFTIDDVSVKEVGVASGWTVADQQLDIPQTALQSYNQLAWFDGQNDYCSISDNPAFTFGTGGTNDSAMSVSAWIYMNDATSFSIMGKYGASDKEWLFDVETNDKLRFQAYDQSADARIGRKYNTALTSREGQWLHVVAAYSGNEASSGISLYINGQSVDDTDYETGSYSGMENLGSNIFIGGNQAGGKYANGCITETSIWAHELTNAEVQELYNDGKALHPETHSAYLNDTSKLQGYWRNNGLAIWTDLSTAFDRHGTPTNTSETILLPAGVDASRDTQGFLMNRQKTTNSLNLPDVGDVGPDNTDNVYVNLNSNPLVTSTIGADHNPFSISCWIKPERTYSAGPHSIVWLGESDTSLAMIGIENGETTGKSNLSLAIDMNNPTRPTYKDVITNSEWNHIVISCESGTHTGSNTQNGHALSGEPLVDSAANYAVDELIGALIENNTQDAYGKITDNNATQIASTGAYMSSGDSGGTLTFETGTVGLSQVDGTDKPHNNANAYNVIKVYINGECNFDLLDFDDTGSPSGVDNDGKYYIGTDDAANRQFVGQVDDVLVYDNKWLTQKEVTRIYKAGKRSHR